MESNEKYAAFMQEVYKKKSNAKNVGLKKETNPTDEKLDKVKKKTESKTSIYTELELLPRLLKAKHICDCLGVSYPTVYDLFTTKKEQGGIPCFTVGKSRRVDRNDFLEWLEARKKEAEIKQG